VYCLLDASWDAFTFFCTAYGAAGRQLGPLVAAAVQQFAKGLLAGPDTAFGKQVQLVHTQQELEHKVMELQQQLAAVQAELEQERSCHAQTRQQLQGANDQVARYPEALQGPRSKSRATGKPVWLTASAEDTPSARWARHLQVDLGKGKRRSQLLRELREDKEVFTSMHCM
jgi:Tfp pilus assembly protein FimV